MRADLRLAAVIAMMLVAAPGPSTLAEEPQAPSAQASVPPDPGAATTTPSETVLDNQEAQGILGKEVRSSAGENMGRIVDVIVDRDGQVRGAVIDFGGFLGVGSRKIVVDWAALHVSPTVNTGRITLDLTRDQVKAAPEYKDGKPVVVLGALPPVGPPTPEM